MGSGIYFPISAIAFSLLIITVFLIKRPIKSVETRIYKYLLIINFLGLVIELLCTFAAYISDTHYIISDFILKLYLVYNITFTALLTIYVYYISIHNDKEVFKYKNTKICVAIIYLISVFFVYYLKCNLVIKNNFQVRYTEGPSVIFTYILCGILIALMLVFILRDKGNIKSKKYIPVFVFIITLIIGIIIQTNYPGILIMTYIETLTLSIMFHTIENPDIKMLYEVHKAKEISDNANEEKAMFLYNMTNEIRNITKDIDYSANAILNETDNKKVNVEIISNSAREIKGSTAKFTTMTNEILDISQIDSANIKIYNDKYNVKLIIKELIQIYKAKSENKGLDFRTSIASDIPDYLYGDSVGLKTSLNIILDNSVKYTSSGYVEFNVSSIIKNDICRLIITVEDSGIGMKAEEIGKIFNRKEKEKDNLNLSNNLYNAKKLITLMNGTIIPSSVYGKGTVMKIVLDQKAAEVDNNLAKYESIYDKKRILLVDDNESSIKIINKLLADTNIELDSVTLGSECLEKIRNKEKYDLILLDEKMKPLDGITVMKKLKDIRTFNTKVILLSRDNNHEYDEEYLKYGFSDYILKPIDKEKFREKIDKCLK